MTSENDSQSRAHATPPIRVNMLEYEHVDEAAVQKKQRRKQFLAGMAAPYALAIPVVVVGSAMQDVPPWLAISYVLVLIAIVVCVQVWTSWRAFLPGVLTGIFVVPILFAVLCTVVVVTVGGAMSMR